MVTSSNGYTVKEHFSDRAPVVKETYDAIVRAARDLGPVKEDPKKTSIHLVRKTAFAGIATRKAALILTLKAASDLNSGRIMKREKVSANRWHVEIKLQSPENVDKELIAWLRNAYELSA